MPIKMMVLVKRKAGLSPEEFRNGYETSHARIAVELFGHLWTDYRRNYLTTGNAFGLPSTGSTPAGPAEVGFDAVSEFIVRDQAALTEMGRISKEHHQMIKDDEGLWFDQERSFLMMCETVEEEKFVRRV